MHHADILPACHRGRLHPTPAQSLAPTLPPSRTSTHGRPAERGYRTITSSAVPLNLEDLTLDRAGGGHSAASAAALLAAGDSEQLGDAEDASGDAVDEPGGGGGGGSRNPSRAGSVQDLGAAAAGGGSESEGGGLAGEQAGGAGGGVPFRRIHNLAGAPQFTPGSF